MSDRVTASVGGIGPEVSLALSTDAKNIIIKRYKGKAGLKALDTFIEHLKHERNWLAAEIERDG